MSRHGRPHQPRWGQDDAHRAEEAPGPAGVPATERPAGAPTDALDRAPGEGRPGVPAAERLTGTPEDVPGRAPAGDPAAAPAGAAPAGDGAAPDVRIRLNGSSKVTLLGDDDFEEVPGAGGRFSAWRRHRLQRSAGRMLTASRAAAQDGAEHSGSTAVGAAGDRGASVVAFPASPASRRRRRRLGTALGAVVALAVFAGALFLSPLFAVRDIAVRGADLVDPARVESALEPYLGVPLTRISKAEVRESVGTVPQVRSLEVLLEPPHRLVVALQERVPVAAVEDAGEYVVVDSDGVQLTTAATAEEAGVPVVTGGRQVLETERFDVIADVLAALPESVLAQLSTASAESLSSVELVFTDGRTVVWGTAENSDLKAQVLRELVEARGAASGVETYDVSSPTRPVIR